MGIFSVSSDGSPGSTPPGVVAAGLGSGGIEWTHAHAASVYGNGQCLSTTAG